MEKAQKGKLAALIAGIIIIVLASFSLGAKRDLLSTGSVSQGSEHQSTTTRSTSASATAGYQLCSSRGVLGSIVVNQVGTAGYVQVHDATSTATSTYASTDTSSSSPFTTLGKPIAKVTGASDAAGTLTYDLNSFAGLVVETSTGFDGEYTITYRCN